MFESKFYSQEARAKCILNKYCIETEDCSNGESSKGSKRSSKNVGNSSERSEAYSGSLRLPTIELPKFSGEHESWLEFRDLFESMVNQSDASNIQKYHYLRAALQGEAAEAIKSLEFSAKTYHIAWNTVCERYNNQSLLVQNHIKALFSLEVVGKETSSQIRKLVDTVSKHLRALEQLEQPTTHWDALLIYMVSSKLPLSTMREWEKIKCLNAFPTWENLKSFLTNRVTFLKTLEMSSNQADTKLERRHWSKQVDIGRNMGRTKSLLSAKNTKCLFCKNTEHSIERCTEFLKLGLQDRFQNLQKLRLCANCFSGGHIAKDCHSVGCSKCNGKHNVLLHRDTSGKPIAIRAGPSRSSEEVSAANKISTEKSTGSVGREVVLSSFNTSNHVFLATALVEVFDKHGNSTIARVVLDAGSQSSYVTMDMVQRLGLETNKVHVIAEGLENMKSTINLRCDLKIKSLNSDYITHLNCLVVNDVTGNIPNVKLKDLNINIPEDIIMADPEFETPRPVQILIGADRFWNLLCMKQLVLGANKPVLQKTKLGWVVSGEASNILPESRRISSPKRVYCNLSQGLEIQDQLAKFWEIEETSNVKERSAEEKLCESYFQETTTRNTDGRFMVSIPLKNDLGLLGESKTSAIKRFLSLEKKLQRNEVIKEKYLEFMTEYINLGHMSKVEDSELAAQKICYYAPHHGVYRENALSTKLRVVFDCSAETSSGCSFNDLQMVGPVVQDELISILLRFRQYQFVISADICKMYRQILVNPSQRNCQLILWRKDNSEPLETYQLNTVTYGTASAPWLATRCLYQLALDCKDTLPDVSRVIEHDLYVDDLLSGANTVEEASYICEQVSKILKSAGFELKKWQSNDMSTLKSVDDHDLKSSFLEFGENTNTKTLGLIWSVNSDKLMYSINSEFNEATVTKRTVLSQISQIYDPLGLLSPCTIIGKILIQRLWLEKLTWDQPLPPGLRHSWVKFNRELPKLNDLEICRHVICQDAVDIQLHGFADASENAYGGCVYIRSVDKCGKVYVCLLTAKSKVAPLKTITVPRLELCGALVLARLFEKVVKSLTISFSQVYLWTDSTVVLNWLKTPPSTLKQFVANRVAEIQATTCHCEWRKVPTKENPADTLSRGLFPELLMEDHRWWFGPTFLKEDSSLWPENVLIDNVDLPEMRTPKSKILLSQQTLSNSLIDRFSTLSKLKRVTAYLLRFRNNCLRTKADRDIGPLSLIELENALLVLVKLAQGELFAQEIADLSNGRGLNKKSSTLRLSPFVDKSGILRVGGRLKNSEFDFNKKHPMLLSAKHKLTKLIFEDEHVRLCHAGPQLLLASVREKFWPLVGRNLAKSVVNKCVVCFRQNAKISNPIMGNLPKSRFAAEFPFCHTGVDYAGHFFVRNKQGKGSRLTKCYVSLFVCFASKAIHLELVSDLSTESFIMAFRRFLSRRGRPQHVYSDQGRNFVGAASELKELGKFLSDHERNLLVAYQREQVQWNFIPARSPHFGGLWEAGVKALKHHLKRVMGNANLTYEQFETLLTQIEAILNSRPISPLSSDPSDLSPLTPAHFLIGRNLIDVPDPSLNHLKESRLSCFQRIQKIKQDFWRRWNKEYVSELQQRNKWLTSQGSQLEIDTLVLIKEDNLPPLYWKMGRVVAVHQGSDGVARVARIKTADGEITRSFAKICPLPVC